MNQSNSVAGIASAVEEMIGNIGSVNNSVGFMVSSFQGLTKKTDEGITRQENVNEKILLITV